MLQFMGLQGAGHDLVTEPQQDRPCVLHVFVVCELTLEGRASPWFHFGWSMQVGNSSLSQEWWGSTGELTWTFTNNMLVSL